MFEVVFMYNNAHSNYPVKEWIKLEISCVVIDFHFTFVVYAYFTSVEVFVNLPFFHIINVCYHSSVKNMFTFKNPWNAEFVKCISPVSVKYV